MESMYLLGLMLAKGRGIEVVKGAGEKLPFRDRTFGGALLIVTLCFVDDPSEVLGESKRVLMDDGSIILGLILKESPWARFYEEGRVDSLYKIARFYD